LTDLENEVETSEEWKVSSQEEQGQFTDNLSLQPRTEYFIDQGLDPGQSGHNTLVEVDPHQWEVGVGHITGQGAAVLDNTKRTVCNNVCRIMLTYYRHSGTQLEMRWTTYYRVNTSQ